MNEISIKIDDFFTKGVSFADIQIIKSAYKNYTNLLEKLSEEELDEQRELIVELKDKFQSLFLSIEELEKIQNDAKLDRERVQQELKNAKKNVVDKVVDLIQNEKDISKAFITFNTLKEEWSKIEGEDRDLDKKYAKLVEDFYYHINMYRAIQDHDFKKNQQLKQELIIRLKALLNVKSVSNILPQLKQIQKEWQAIGPVGKEMKELIWNEYIQLTEAVFALHIKIKEEENTRLESLIASKKQLIDKAQEVLAIKERNVNDWKNHTNDMIALQNQWKTLSELPAKINHSLFYNFRKIMDEFFKQKDEYFATLKNQTDSVVKLKQDLISQVKEILAQEEEVDKAKKIIEVQKQWKVSGSLPPKLDKKMWDEFKQLCDSFFKAKEEEKKVLKEQQFKESKVKYAIIQKINKDLSVDDLRNLFVKYIETLNQSSNFTLKNDMVLDEFIFEWVIEQKNRAEAEEIVLSWYKQFLTKELLQSPEVKTVVKHWLSKTYESLALIENNLSFFGKSNSPMLNALKLNIEFLTQKTNTLKYVLKG
ncbi:MAG: hypothetical protein RLZZ414_2050 [Bacteroidota bacterium]|jgi:hypothetical protein